MKKNKFVFIFAFMFVFLCKTIGASEYASVPENKVTFNDTEVDNGSREYPLLLYKNITYFPLTYYDCRHLGLITEWSDSTKSLSVKKENITGAYREYNSEKTNDLMNEIEICPFNIYVNGKRIDNEQEEYPFLMFRGVTYFPLTWRFAVEEFGWNYYYYTGTENRVFRVPCNDFSKREVVHTLEYTYYPDTTPVDFSFDNGNLYMSYHVGGASTGTSYRYEINGDGNVEKSDEGTHYTGGIGFNGYVIDGDGFTVERTNTGRTGTTVVRYKLDGTDEFVEIKQDGVIFGEYKDISMDLNNNGKLLGSNNEGNVWFNEPQIIGKAIYLTGYETESNKNSDLYRVDVLTGNIEKVLEDVKVFHTFYGWDNDGNAMSEMVLYEMRSRGNMLYRFSYLSKKMYYIEGYIPRLKSAVGDNDIVAVFDDGKTSYVWCYDGYGVGNHTQKVFESNKGFEFSVDNGLMIGISHYADDVKSVFLNNHKNFTKTCELPSNICVFKNTVMMTIQNEDNNDAFVVKMNME